MKLKTLFLTLIASLLMIGCASTAKAADAVVGTGTTVAFTLRGSDAAAVSARQAIVLDRLRWALNSKDNLVTFSANKDGTQSIYTASPGSTERYLILTVTSSDCLYQKMDLPTLTSHWAVALSRAIDEAGASSN